MVLLFKASHDCIVEALLAVILKIFGFTFILQIKVENFCYRHHGKSNHIDKLSVWNECYIIALCFKHFKLTNNYITIFFFPSSSLLQNRWWSFLLWDVYSICVSFIISNMVLLLKVSHVCMVLKFNLASFLFCRSKSNISTTKVSHANAI